MKRRFMSSVAPHRPVEDPIVERFAEMFSRCAPGANQSPRAPRTEGATQNLLLRATVSADFVPAGADRRIGV